ncbi:MAG: hypothetical protein ACI31M_02210 [Bacilli bacterium]
MKTINISQKRFSTLEKMELSKEIITSESIIYKFDYQNSPKIFKKLFNIDGLLFANKLYTVEMLNTFKDILPEVLAIPDYMISINHIISGFTVPKIDGIPLTMVLKDKKVELEEIKKLLKQIGELLNKLKAIRKNADNQCLKDFFLNDLHESNFVVDENGKLHAVDLDSCKIANNQIAASLYLTSYDFIKYNKKYKRKGDMIIPSEDTDLYCYYMIIFNYLFGRRIGMFSIEEFYRYLSYLEDIGFDHELLECFYKITEPCPNVNPMDYLESLSCSQVGRARENVYKLNRK